MTGLHYEEDVAPDPNESSLAELAWAIEASEGNFSLILARCNSASLRQRLIEKLQVYCSLEIREIVLDKCCMTLCQIIQDSLGQEYPQALIISGLEWVRAIEKVLTAANQVREEFRKNFNFPLVLWVTDEMLQKLIRTAPDLQSWTIAVEFAIATNDLIDFIQQTTDQVFAKVLDAGAGRFLDSTALNLGVGSPNRVELESAWQELQKRGVSISPELEASLEFVLGRVFHDSMEKSRQHYERSLTLFDYSLGAKEAGENNTTTGEITNYQLPNLKFKIQNPQSLERLGCLLYSLGIWWRSYGVANRCEHEQACEQAKNYFQQCIQIFEQAHRPELVAKFINALGGVLQRRQRWQELETIAHKALALHQTYLDHFKLARAYGFLAEIALTKSDWNEAKQTAEQALLIFANAEEYLATSVSPQKRADLDWERSYHRGWYLFALGRSLFSLGELQQAIITLETAKAQTKPQYDPLLYIGILGKLRDAYFQQGKYLTAFNIKQKQRSIEQQYGFRTFIGAGQLQPRQQITNPVLPVVEKQESVAQEIVASGRQKDINRLIERMYRSDHKLTIIYGQSGVGISSILQAGLIPALKQKPIGTRDVLFVFQRVYTDWIKELAACLGEAFLERGNFACDITPQTPSLRTKSNFDFPLLLEEGLGERSILEQLQKHDDDNLLTVLIFDQLEEFFFVYKEAKQRRQFYDFLRQCLDIPYVKVILSLREDYLHHLSECNNRLTSLDVINNNILDKDILYYVDNFSQEDAKTFIKKITEKTQFLLEEDLINELVNDLSRDLGEVRPIELQVVGAQLQTEKITSLTEYHQYGPKEKLVGRFLEEIIKDCGPENQHLAKLVLYLLTDENNNPPQKTRADLESELNVRDEKLDLVLEILVKSGLVFKLPASPTDRYQLVHDYLVNFIRQKKGTELLAELEYAREQQSLSEKLVERYLAQVIDSCGSKNKQIAKQVLYLLTDENNTCPLRSRKELELELDVKGEQLNLVLEKLVESGILLKKLAFPTEQYQLFHDYLSYFVRQEQSARLFTELQKEREKRKLSEAKLSELMKQLQKTRQELIWKVTLGVIAGVFGILEAFMYLW